jgi:hypothetical protein
MESEGGVQIVRVPYHFALLLNYFPCIALTVFFFALLMSLVHLSR